MFFFFITLLSLLGRRLVGDRSATSCIKSQRGPHEVADQSATSRRPTAKPSCDSSATSATSAIVMNFGRGEVAERLQCMSDWGFTLPYLTFHSFKLTWSATSRGPVGFQLHQVAKRSPRDRRSVCNQSPITRRPTAKPSCDSSATSEIVVNLVAERLQCMSDRGLNELKHCCGTRNTIRRYL